MKKFDDDADAREFEERADFIDNDDLMSWTVKNDFFLAVHKKILQRGAKLIVGPRGTGKTHQMKFAYNTCLKSKDKTKPLAIYVSFTKYYHLEPLLSKKSNAISIFHTWVLSKILLGCYDLLQDLDISNKEIYEESNVLSRDSLKKFCEDAEKGININDNIITKVTINEVIDVIGKLTIFLGKKRAILLLDDAALRLTPEYLIEFFDIFGSLKTINIAPKASVYPGTTVYGPRFHVGHDAEKVSSWLEIRNNNYSQFMDGLIEQRSLDIEAINKDIVEIFKYAAFGIPRHFINLLRNYSQSQSQYPEETYQKRFNKIIEQQAESIKVEYLSFAIKLPQYQNIINTSWRLHEKIVEIITTANKNIAVSDEKQLQFSILKEHDLTRNRMFQFLIEAGLLYELEEFKEGSNKVYKRYIPHLLFLVKSRAFSTGKGFKASEVIQFIKRREKKHSIRRDLSNVLNSDEIKLNLNLPPCQSCGFERLTEQQKFCHNCGKELVRQSTFDLCMKIKINELPLTELQKQRIKEQTKLRTLGDFLSSLHIGTELRKTEQIGPKRAKQIHNKVMKKMAEEFLS